MLSIDQIMERISRLDCRASIGFREDFYRYNQNHECRWYLDLGSVVCSHPSYFSGLSTLVFGFSGSSPEEAINNGWNQILKDGKENRSYLRYKCKLTDRIENSEWLMFVKWNQDIDDWENVSLEGLGNRYLKKIVEYNSKYPDSSDRIYFYTNRNEGENAY